MTEAERLLWFQLRDRRLAGLKFRRQVPIGPYIVDFVCPEKKVIVEIDGGQHNLPNERSCDLERTRFLEAKGYKVLRFWNNEVMGNLEGVLAVILSACQVLDFPLTLPSPPLGERGLKNQRGRGD